MKYLLAVVFCLGALVPIPGQDRAPETWAFVRAAVTASGTLSVSITGYGLDPNAAGPILQSEFGCRANKIAFTDEESPEWSCKARGYVPQDQQDHRVDLAGLVRQLHVAGANRVSISTDASSGVTLAPADSSWKEFGRSFKTYQFESNRAGELPSALVVKLQPVPSAKASPAVALAVVLLLPVALALWIRKRAPQGRVIWVFCLSNAIWLYWLSAWDSRALIDFVESQSWGTVWIAYLASAAMFSGPQLLALGLVGWLLLESVEETKMLVIANAAQMAPLGIFFAGQEFWDDPAIPFGSMLFAYLAHNLAQGLLVRTMKMRIREVVGGDWFAQVKQLADRAGVKLQKLLLHKNRGEHDLNAFAIPGNVVMLSEGLLERMTRREVESIVGHELGHLKKHDGALQGSVWLVYFLFGAPMVHTLLEMAHAPALVYSLPIATVLFILLMARVSQFHEYRADAFAGAVTGDPQATIASLGRLGQITKMGLRWHPIASWILTHPSMENRALSLARKFNIPKERALEILNNPDVLRGPDSDLGLFAEAVQAAEPERREAATLASPHGPVFTVESVLDVNNPETARFAKQVGWVTEAAIVLTVAVLGFAGQGKFAAVTMLAAIPLAAYLGRRAGDYWDRRQFGKWAHELRGRLSPPESARFVALRPGREIRYVNGTLDWDLGFLWFAEGRLWYRGERVAFSLSADSVWQVEKQWTRTLWSVMYGVHVKANFGSFSVRDGLASTDGDSVGELLASVENWWLNSSTAVTEPAMMPLFPELSEGPSSAVGTLILLGWKMIKLLLIGTILSSLFPMFLFELAMLPLLAPIAYFFERLPMTVRASWRSSMKTKFSPRFAERVPPPVTGPPPLPELILDPATHSMSS